MRSIFVPLHHAETAPALLRHAGQLATTLDAAINVAFVSQTGVIDEPMTGHDQAGAESCRVAFDSWLAAGGDATPVARWRDIPDGAVYASASFARASDLTLAGSGGVTRGSREANAGRRFLRDALLDSGRATILLPDGSAPGAVATACGLLDHVVLAWDGSLGASRALGQAAPLLSRASRVSVMIIGRNTLGERARELIADSVRLHHPGMQLSVLDNGHRQTGRVLIEALHRAAASLVVMGVCGRSHPLGSPTGLGGTIIKVVEDDRIPILTAG